MKDIKNWIRPDLLDLKPYSSARDEFEGEASIYLDANENPFENGVNRYPDPYQLKLKNKLAEIKGIQVNELLLGNGSDECIDLLFRLFCVPGKDFAASIAPSYGMYQVSAKLNQIPLKEITLNDDFTLDTAKVLNESKGAKLLFICSPNNPSGNAFELSVIEEIAQKFEGILVVDEAYVDFSDKGSVVRLIQQYPNLAISQTLSKAYGMAGIRLGLLIANPSMIQWLNKIKPPYNINQLTQSFALEQLNKLDEINAQIQYLVNERKRLLDDLKTVNCIVKIYPSDANFILVKVNNANEIYQSLIQQGIVVRNRSTQVLCENTLRLTIGTKEENDKLIVALKQF